MAVTLSPMAAFEPYVCSLERLARKVGSVSSPTVEDGGLITAALDGQPSAKLRELVALPTRRSAGAFFTGAAVAKRALGSDTRSLSDQSVVYDPACGAGDFLVACARRLPPQRDLAATVARWGEQLRGLDLHPQFIRAAKARLVLLAIAQGLPMGGRPLPPLEQTFPHLRVGNAFEDAAFNEATHVVLNPPYAKVPAPLGCSWGSGKVSQAALFMDRCLADATAATRIVAILPDVLRTGANYAKWRAGVEARATIESVEVIGMFDTWADVDVFVLRLVVGAPLSARSVAWWQPPESLTAERVGDRFDVHVGPVVPHRHKKVGRWHPYVYARLLPPWGTLTGRIVKRRFRGRTYAPPFVAVRRTSAPGDKWRALATIVAGQQPVAVENHLLVLEPHNGSLETCKGLLAVLRDGRTNHWLDERIRCRHLTVGALRDLPWWDSVNDH